MFKTSFEFWTFEETVLKKSKKQMNFKIIPLKTGMRFTLIQIISKIGQGVILFLSILQPEVIVSVSFTVKYLNDSRSRR